MNLRTTESASISVLICIYLFSTFESFRWCSEDPKFWCELMSSQGSEMSSSRLVVRSLRRVCGAGIIKDREACLDLVSTGAAAANFGNETPRV